MSLKNEIDYKDKILLLESSLDEYRQRIYFEKSLFKSNEKDQYFIKAYKLENGILNCIGYIYFYIDEEEKMSTYIGTYVKKECRNSKIASLLTSMWIKFCLENGIYNLNTNKKQKKPFLIYLLKKFNFDLEDKDEYQRSKYNIHICRRMFEPDKYLLFQNEKQKETFIRGKTYREDNYKVIDSIDFDTEKLDTILLSTIYELKDENEAYKKSLKIVNRY